EAESEHHRCRDLAARRRADGEPCHAGAKETREQGRPKAEASVERLDSARRGKRSDARQHPQHADVPRRETKLARGEQHDDGEVSMAEHLPYRDRPGERAQRRVVPDLGQTLADLGADAATAELRRVALFWRNTAQDP